MKALYLALFGLLLAPQVIAQPNKTLSPDKVIQIADESLGKSDTYNALEWYQKAYDNDPTNVYVINQLAITYDRLRDYKQAVDWYGKLFKADTKGEYPLARYKYAYTLKLNGKYNECITEFMGFMQNYNGEDAAKWKKFSEIEIEGARWAMQNPEPYEPLVIENLNKPVNTTSSEDGPFLQGRDVIFYSSLRTDTLIFVEEAPEDKKIAKIYTSTRGDDGKWVDSKEFNTKALQKAGFHAVQPVFTPDNTIFYFVRAQLEGNMLKNSRIFVCAHKDGVLEEPRQLDFNSPNHVCKTPSVGVIDGKQYLFFSSNMEGGKGGYDIWYAEINPDGTTRQPLNMGDQINTIADEISPFYDSRENVFYFSSQGHPTVGGFDVFKSKNESGKFTKPENMGFGFNSRVDDFGFVINQVGKDDCYGYVVSNRPGTMSMKSETCCDDIFSVLMPDRCDIDVVVSVTDQTTGKPIKGSTVQIIDKATGKVVAEQTNKEGNEFTFPLSPNKEYTAVAKKDGFEKPDQITPISTLKKDIGEVTKPVSLTQKTQLREVGLVVETYNAKTQAALTGVNVVIIDPKTNAELKKEQSDSKNRYAFGLDRDREFKIVASRSGYKEEVRNMTLAQVQAGELQKLYLVPMELPIFYDILFNFNADNLRQGALDTLQVVLKTLKENPTLIVEVRGHTDGKGSDGYNDRLSARRVKSSMDWLEKEGIARERLVPRALGKREPKADNEVNGVDNPEGRQMNRRVEFKIIDAKDISPDDTKPNTPTSTTTDSKADKMGGAKNTDNKADKMSGGKGTDNKADKMSGGNKLSDATKTTVEPAKTAADRPKTTVKFDLDNPNMGQIKMGEVREFKFEFTNTGKEEFVVENIAGSCSCTEIIDFTKRVAPGKKGNVKVRFDSKKAKVQNAYPSGLEIFANTPSPLTLVPFTVDVK